jgi:hypothetical protein
MALREPKHPIEEIEEEEELKLLHESTDEIETKQGIKLVSSEDMQRIINIVEEFIRSEKLICYGGTAINNILPNVEQFYDKLSDIPDYDVFSKDALKKAKLLADTFFKAGFMSIQAKAGIHAGTFKVYVDFIPVADITYLDPKLFNIINKDAIIIDGIRYAPPNYLRMEMYKELSRPESDTTRWEKVLTRLNLLNRVYPITNSKCNLELFKTDFERKNTLDENNDNSIIINKVSHGESYYKKLYSVIKNNMIRQGVVFFGCYAMTLYGKYMDEKKLSSLMNVPDFDILSDAPEVCSETLKEGLLKNGFKNITINKRVGYGEIISSYFEVNVDGEAVCFIYETLSCHNYNTIVIGTQRIKVASIDTMSNLFLAMYYSKQSKHNQERILCMTQYLYDLQMKNRSNKKGILKRFSSDCYGYQETLQEIKLKRELLFKGFKRDRIKKSNPAYQKYFMKYTPNSRTVKHGIVNKRKNKNKSWNNNNNKENNKENKKMTRKRFNNNKKK